MLRTNQHFLGAQVRASESCVQVVVTANIDDLVIIISIV